VKELLCEECRDRVARSIERRGAEGKNELAYINAVNLKREAEELMAVLEKQVF
tara:strand:+ start:1696 stop:1854 length:159 start_codon:yes stop_codon:yes gene_type:complete